MELVRQHFESRSLIEVCDYLTEVTGAQQYIASNYGAILDRTLETQRQFSLSAALRDAAAIAQHGRTQGSGKQKKTLRGVRDAIDYLMASLPDMASGNDGPQDVSIESAIAAAKERAARPSTPTGIPALDTALRGGLPGASIIVVTAPPGNFKSTLLGYLASMLAAAGNPVAYMAVDEGTDRAATRLANAGVKSGPIRMASAQAFLEDQAERVAQAAAKATRAATIEAIMRRPRAIGDEDNDAYIEMRARDWGLVRTGVLVVDSLQCVPCRGAQSARDQFARLEAVMNVLRALTERHGVLIIASSEANRGSFSRKNDAENSAGLASAKGSSAIEYKADVACTLRKTGDGIRLRIEKNRLGPDEPEVYLHWDGRAFAEVGAPPPVGDNDESVVLDVIAKVTCRTSRELRVACKDDGRITSYERVQAALTSLKLKHRINGGNGMAFAAAHALDAVAT
ncbi:MAG: DnaB-like helicase C-terminal domain-containing protein [Polyangiaceae bacterium]